MRKKIVAGNWKMNHTLREGEELVKDIISKLKQTGEIEVILIPPFIHLDKLNQLKQEAELKLGAQNCHSELEGAYTGEVSANMLASVGVQYVLIGHSERREYNGETDEVLLKKLNTALNSGLIPVFCCGEKLEDRKVKKQYEVVKKQLEVLWCLPQDNLKHLVIAYEPVWAIGTGETATAEQAQEMHSYIRQLIAEKTEEEIAKNIAILYGGSCKPSNAKEIFKKKDVDGGLIGGASLNADDFVSIINSFE